MVRLGVCPVRAYQARYSQKPNTIGILIMATVAPAEMYARLIKLSVNYSTVRQNTAGHNENIWGEIQ